MPVHEFPDDEVWDSGVDVHRVQPYNALKEYRCPGCDLEIRTGQGHTVVVPRRTPDDRRHWHTSCWARATRAKGPSR